MAAGDVTVSLSLLVFDSMQEVFQRADDGDCWKLHPKTIFGIIDRPCAYLCPSLLLEEKENGSISTEVLPAIAASCKD